MAIINISFFRTQRQRVFHYKPRHWDPEKEDLERRKRRVEESMGIKPEVKDENAPYRPNIKGEMMRQLEFGKRKVRGGGKNMRMVGLLVLLMLFVAAYFSSNLFGLLFSGVNEKATKKEQEQVKPAEERSGDTHFIIPIDDL